MRKINKASRAQLIAIHQHLSEKLICIDEANKMYEFKTGFTDATIAEDTQSSINAVKGARLELFGRIRYQTSPNTIDNNLLKAELKDLHERFNKLVITLSVNKVADVRHLQSVFSLKD